MLEGVILIINNMNKVMEPLMQFSEWFPKILSVKVLFKKMDEVLINQNNYIETLDMDTFKESIEFNDVSFSYEGTEVFKDISLSIKKRRIKRFCNGST